MELIPQRDLETGLGLCPRKVGEGLAEAMFRLKLLCKFFRCVGLQRERNVCIINIKSIPREGPRHCFPGSSSRYADPVASGSEDAVPKPQAASVGGFGSFAEVQTYLHLMYMFFMCTSYTFKYRYIYIYIYTQM